MTSGNRGGWRPALTLFCLAPFVGEYLLGNLTLEELPLGIILAPMYGCGALLVREIGRRVGGWPTMACLAAAYALMEEGPIDQLLWNPDYAGQRYLDGPAYLEGMGINVATTLTIVALHGVWSISVPIALVEAMWPDRADRPWLRSRGLAIVAALYVAGGVLVFFGNYSEEDFVASPGQLALCTAVIVALVVGGFVLRGRRLPSVAAAAPSPWLVGGATLLLTSAYWGPANLITAESYQWAGVAVWVAAGAIGVALLSRWARSHGWTPLHRYAAAAGATLTYIWTAFPVEPESETTAAADLISNIVFGVLGLLVLVFAWRRVTTPSLGSGRLGEGDDNH